MLYEQNDAFNFRPPQTQTQMFGSSHPMYSESGPPEQSVNRIPNPIHANNSAAQDQEVTLLGSLNFRIFYWKGKGIDTSNTVLHQAIKNKDYEEVKYLLENGRLCSSLNSMDNQGMTPLMVAVRQGEESIIELLLQSGADPNKENPNDFKTALHMASTLKNSQIVRLLLKYGAADSILLEDKKKYTPVQRGVITGNVDAIEAMLEYKPEIAKNFNQPDSYGVTDIQRAGRSGNIKMVGLLLKHTIEETIKVDPEASFRSGDLAACQADPIDLNYIPVDHVAVPLVIAQNYCSTMVKLNNGEVLQLPNADAQEVADYIRKKSSNDKISGNQRSNILTIYMSPGHGFLRIECGRCDKGKPYNENHGFYPNGNFLKQRKGKRPGNTSYDFVDVFENIFSNQKGHLGNENPYEHDSDSKNSLKMMLYIDDYQAQAALEKIQEVADACKRGKGEEPCRYNAFGDNCVTFLQKVYESIGGNGYFADLFTSEQLNYGHFTNPARLYEFKATSYAFVQSRWSHNEANEKITDVYQQQLHELVVVDNQPVVNSLSGIRVRPFESNANASYILLLGAVLPVAIYKIGNYFSEVWSRFGTPVAEEDFRLWYEEKIGILGKILKGMNEAGKKTKREQNALDDMIRELNDSENKEDKIVLLLLKDAKAKWQKIGHASIDLLCAWVELENKIKNSSNRTLPTKSYLERLEGEISQLSSNYETLESEMESTMEEFEM